MATSSQEQPTTVNTSQKQAPTSKRRLWLRLLISFSVFIAVFLVISSTLIILTYTKILPQKWFVISLTTVAPTFGIIGAFINTTLSDKDFQQALRKRLIGTISSDTTDKTSDNKDSKDAATQAPAQPSIAITFSPTIANTNTSTSTANVASEPLKEVASNHPDSAMNSASISLTAQLPIKSLSSSDAIFFVSTKLTNPKEFYGRAIEQEQLLSHTRKGGCTSIIGPRRIGKTWLLTYLRLVAAQELGANFRIGYMSAALPSSVTIAGFSRAALKALGYPSSSLSERPDLQSLEHFVRDIVIQNNVPILCIDEFEGLTHHTAFDLDFFEGLRAITEIGLGLVVLSKKRLIEIVSENTRTSPFFNVFQELPLAPFDRADAEKFWREKGTQAQFTDQERAYVLAYSRADGEQFPPLRLQLVGNMLMSEKYVTDPVAQQRYRPNNLEYWLAFKERVDTAYSGMVKS